ncbi:class I SAM-dependent DNA methyltransferase [Spirosoma sp. KUDC1026]|uniref:type I restriction-modification system subunit M n=1 Tax=Spirosoma sp. KUDC1026 TaxID=2745947 RepID=UPI00159BAC2B|nr:class I SAM-dependent DNA methyltransferase [Spirosoma sp. KUDC1026]QKZ12712.1 SAM-dependent DNA methyltransferase [Spirosoma sp. KUDC1026]
MINFRERANFIWSVADLLRGDYKQAEYGKVILPLTVLRRLDCLLEPTKDAVLTQYVKIQDQSETIVDRMLNRTTTYRFHNRSNYTFQKLVGDPDNVAANLRTYLSGFSTSVRDIMEQFRFEDQIERLDRADLLYVVIKRFAGLDLIDVSSLEMGYIFEELIRKFAEISNETAGEHFTPREVIELMVNLLFIDETDIYKKGAIRTLYDPTAGTGGMLSVADAFIKSQNPDATLLLFGQEINPESYAICKSDMLIKGQEPGNIREGDTLKEDHHASETFDYMLSNPPFGVDWKKSEKLVKAEHEKKGFAGRFGPGLPRINDGSLLFLLHMTAKMKAVQVGGSRIGIVLNGSPLFTGGAGSGESEIRRWIIENDMLEAIVALPDQLFYNTGISTYIWIVTNHKSRQRKGKVQLINATTCFQKMSRSLGNKRNEISAAQIQEITRLYGEFAESEQVKIYPNEFFGYSRITVERPVVDADGKPVSKKGRKSAPLFPDATAPVYEPDTSLRDAENVPLLDDIQTYFEREVKPHVPDAWIDHSKTKIGYEINFTKYFYQYKPLRSLAEIRADILALEAETEGLIHEVLD